MAGTTAYRGPLIGSMAALNVAMITWWAQPINIDALTHLPATSLTLASLVVSVELLCLAVVSYAMSLQAMRFEARALALVATVLILAIDVIDIFAGDYRILIATRGLAGALQGVLLVAANAAIASSPSPDRAYAFQNLSNVVYCGIYLALLPLASEPFGSAGIYAAHAIGVAILLPFLFFLPRQIHLQRTAFQPQDRRRSVRLLVGMLVWTTVAGIPWAGLVELGQRTNMSLHWIGLTASLTGAGGVAGGALAGWWRGSSEAALRVGLIGMVVAAALVAWAPSPAFFTIAAILYVATLFFILPVMLGISAKLDQGGGLPAALGSIYILSGSTSVLISGLLIERVGAAAVFWVVAVGCMGAGVLVTTSRSVLVPAEVG